MITESEAREMKAGAELDRICAEWVGATYDDIWLQWKFPGPPSTWGYSGIAGKNPPKFSTDWAAAGPLLEAMGGTVRTGKKSRCNVMPPGWKPITVYAPTPQLAIARACAVLVARGVERGDL